NGHESIVVLLIEHGADINAQGHRYGNALGAASSVGHEQIVRLFIEHGADTTASTYDGTALHLIVALLIEHGADIPRRPVRRASNDPISRLAKRARKNSDSAGSSNASIVACQSAYTDTQNDVSMFNVCQEKMRRRLPHCGEWPRR
ncbi:hypothetical protein B0H10DRAFT_1808325, partial [Mycena sp. CBHHK59/15]